MNHSSEVANKQQYGKLIITEQGPLLTLKGLKNRAPDYQVIINRKNMVKYTTSYSDDILHFVHVLVHVDKKNDRPEGEKMIKLALESYSDVMVVVSYLTSNN